MKINKHVTKAIAGTVSTSILTASCTYPNPDFISDANNQITDCKEDDLGEAVVPMPIVLEENDGSFILAIQKIAFDIIYNQSIAKELKENPNYILKQYGCTKEVKLDDSIIKIISAFGDDDLHEAIINQDLKKFMKLCEEKELLKDFKDPLFSCSYLSQLSDISKEVKLKNIYVRSAGDDKCVEEYAIGGEPIFYCMGAVAFFVVAVAVIAGVEVAFNAHLGVDSFTYVIGNKSVSEDSKNLMLEKRADILDLYILNNGAKDLYIMRDQFIDDIVEQSVTYIKDNKPDYFMENSEEDFRNLVRLNYMNHLGF